MDKKIKNALLIAGAILVGAAIIALGEFENSNLIVSTIMVAISLGILVNGYYKNRNRIKQCRQNKSLSRNKVLGVTLFAIALFFGLGFAVGKLIYLWSEQI